VILRNRVRSVDVITGSDQAPSLAYFIPMASKLPRTARSSLALALFGVPPYDAFAAPLKIMCFTSNNLSSSTTPGQQAAAGLNCLCLTHASHRTDIALNTRDPKEKSSRHVVLVPAGSSTVPLARGQTVLRKDGFNVVVVQNPTLSLEGDVAAEQSSMPTTTGDLVGTTLRGPSARGAPTHPMSLRRLHRPFAPDKASRHTPSPTPPRPPGVRDPGPLRRTGFLFRPDKFALFAADQRRNWPRSMAAPQVPWGIAALMVPVSEPSWRVSLSCTSSHRDPDDFPRRLSAPCPERAVATPV